MTITSNSLMHFAHMHISKPTRHIYQSVNVDWARKLESFSNKLHFHSLWLKFVVWLTCLTELITFWLQEKKKSWLLKKIKQRDSSHIFFIFSSACVTELRVTYYFQLISIPIEQVAASILYVNYCAAHVKKPISHYVTQSSCHILFASPIKVRFTDFSRRVKGFVIGSG